MSTKVRKTYTCPTCQMTFTLKRKLISHLSRVTGCESEEQILDIVFIHLYSLLEKEVIYYFENVKEMGISERQKRIKDILYKKQKLLAFIDNHENTYNEAIKNAGSNKTKNLREHIELISNDVKLIVDSLFEEKREELIKNMLK